MEKPKTIEAIGAIHKAMGYLLARIIFDEHNRAVDFLILEHNETIAQILHSSVSDYKKASELFKTGGGFSNEEIAILQGVALQGSSARFLLHRAGTRYNAHAYSPSPNHFAILVSPYTESSVIGQPLLSIAADPHKLLEMTQDLASFGTWVYYHNTGVLEWSPETYEIFGEDPSNQNLILDTFIGMVHPEQRQYVEKTFLTSILNDCPRFEFEFRITSKLDNQERYLLQKGVHEKDDTGRIFLTWGVVQDITQKKQASLRNEELKISEKHYRQLFENMTQGFALYDIIRRDDNYPVDYRYIAINPAFENLTGMKREEILGKTMNEFFPQAEGYWYDTFARVTITGKPLQYQNFFEGMDKYFDLWIFKPSENQVAVIFTDITGQKRSEDKILKLTKGIEQSPAVVMITDIQGRIEYVNPKFTEVTGYTPEEAWGKNPSIQKSGIHSKEFYRHMWKTILAGDDWRGIIANRRKNGEIYWESAIITPIKDDEGVIKNFIAIKENITHRVEAEKTLRNSEKKYRLIFENVPVGIFYINRKGIITDCNQNFVDISGSSRQILVGLDFTNLPDERIVRLFSEIKEGRSAQFEGDYTSIVTGNKTSIRLMLSPVMNDRGEMDGAIGLMEDRTAESQQQLLEKQVALAKEAIEFKQNFLANMSHEIRTPLTGIIGMLDILKETPLDQSQKEYVSIMENTSENLMEIVNQVLDFSKIEAGKIKIFIQEFDFHKLIMEKVNAFKKLSKNDNEIHVHISEDLPTFIGADRGRLSQVISNLLNNALKFTEKGTVTLTAEVACNHLEARSLPGDVVLENPVKIKVTITDTGIGISEERKDELFNPFTQLYSDQSRTHTGTGLGLAICRQLVEQHGGHIGFKSTLGSGSSFYFTFLASLCTHKSHDDDDLSGYDDFPHKLQGLRILMAEDKKVNQKVFYILLRNMGFTVTFTNNGRELIDAYEPEKYDMILMDIQMPVMDGITATQKLKEKYPSLPPVIGVSANAFEGDREKYMSAGLDEYITKPLKPADLIDVLQKLNVI
jgi:PAS domain S-box-containing protein